MAESFNSVMAFSPTLASPNLSYSQPTKEGGPPPPRPFSKSFCQRGDPEVTQARTIYLKAYIGGFLTIIVTVFAVFPIYWGSLWKVPAGPLSGWIVV
jgi:hypothetical protein